jgi:hypothetical protein
LQENLQNKSPTNIFWKEHCNYLGAGELEKINADMLKLSNPNYYIRIQYPKNS